MAKYCVYCGNPLKSDDKFCIICGKPVLASVKKPEKTEVEKAREIIKEKKKPREKFVEESIIEDTFEVLPEKPDKKGKKKKDKKGAVEVVGKPLPFEVKEQMILNIEYNDIKLNKQILVEKLKEIQKALKDPRYDVDEEYNKSINLKVTAIKTLISELKQKESELEERMDKPFIIQRIQEDVDKKILWYYGTESRIKEDILAVGQIVSNKIEIIASSLNHYLLISFLTLISNDFKNHLMLNGIVKSIDEIYDLECKNCGAIFPYFPQKRESIVCKNCNYEQTIW